MNEKNLENIMRKGTYEGSAEVEPYDPSQQKLRSIRSDIGIILSSQVIKKSGTHERHFVLETVLNGLIEISSTLDFVSDCIVVY